MRYLLEVSWFRNVFLVSSISSKKQTKQVDLRFHSSKVEFVRLFFGGNVGLKKSLQLFLTFTLYNGFKYFSKYHSKFWKLQDRQQSTAVGNVVSQYIIPCNFHLLCCRSWGISYLKSLIFLSLTTDSKECSIPD